MNHFIVKNTDLDFSSHCTIWLNYSPMIVNTSTSENKDICNNQHVGGEGKDSPQCLGNTRHHRL